MRQWKEFFLQWTGGCEWYQVSAYFLAGLWLGCIFVVIAKALFSLDCLIGSSLSWWERKYVLSLCEARSVISSSFLVTIYSLDSISLHLEDILLGARWLPVLTLVAIQAYSAVDFLGFGSAELLSCLPISSLLWLTWLWFHFCLICEPSSLLWKAHGNRLSWWCRSVGSPPCHTTWWVTIGLRRWLWRVMGTLEAISSLETDLLWGLNFMSLFE